MNSNRDRLVEAGASLFFRRGYRDTSVEDILVEAGVVRSNFYYHFSGKRDLALAVVGHWTRRYDEELIRPALEEGPGDPWSALLGLFQRAAAFQDRDAGLLGCPLGQLASDLAQMDPEIQILLRSYFDHVETEIRQRLEAAQLPGRDPEFADRAATLVVATLEGGLLLSRLRGDPEHVARAGAAVVDLLSSPPLMAK